MGDGVTFTLLIRTKDRPDSTQSGQEGGEVNVVESTSLQVKEVKGRF